MPSSVLAPHLPPVVVLWDGATGSGKTYHAVKLMWSWLKQGAPVLTNVSLSLPKGIMQRLFPLGKYLQFEDMKNIVDELNRARQLTHGHLLVVIDECQLVFNCGDRKAVSEELRSWLSQHRKTNTSIVCITQEYSWIQLDFRRIAQVVVHHRNLTRLQGWLTLLTFWLPETVLSWSEYLSQGKPTKAKFDRHVFWISKKTAALYNTREIYQGQIDKGLAQAPPAPGFGIPKWVFAAVIVGGIAAFRYATWQATGSSMGIPKVRVESVEDYDEATGRASVLDPDGNLQIISAKLAEGEELESLLGREVPAIPVLQFVETGKESKIVKGWPANGPAKKNPGNGRFRGFDVVSDSK